MNYIIDEMHSTDWPEVSAIYLAGIKTEIATFQNEIPSWEEWNQGHSKCCRLVARSDDQVLGWVALSPVSGRCVYAGVAEVSIYINESSRGNGIGTALLNELINQSEKAGYWTLQSGIIKENISSRELHSKCGFREIGYRERVGKMPNDTWHDVILMERRSKVVG
ncbi:GNAT family N-acetyltransferase [Anaeromicropila herbilytica]|uniref:Phosphinothricin N-acetyltransferase n=1 Tax=Anaeromicropila herbilytica TaxID=2785025 RepID=A0A7R7EHN1_9FIRM|nr:GNAT family N-acetyltransferase [Anaeromicropila herbilytica]BCN28929.1 phosphinothricin N-acetyltransferase [Anaeromicropila herbilytica]